VFDVLDNTGVARNPAAPVKHAVAAFAAGPRRRREAATAAHLVAAVLAVRRRVAAATGNAAVPDGRVRVAERRRVLVVDEIGARRRPTRRTLASRGVDGDQ